MSSVKILDKKNIFRKAKAYSYAIFHITDKKHKTEIVELLPFRIKFTNVGIQSYGPGHAAPIGIAIIGLNNYVM